MADEAEKALRNAGFQRDAVQVLYGEEAATRIDATGKNRGPLMHLARSIWTYNTEEGNFLLEYQGEAEAGRNILVAHTEEPEQAKQAGEILKQHGAHLVRYFAPTHMESLWL